MPPSRRAALAIADLLDILPDAVIMVDARGHICYVNPAVKALLGYASDEILDQPLSLLVPRDARERHAALVADFRLDSTPRMMGSRPVLHAVHSSGRAVPVSISLCNTRLDSDEQVTVAVIHDVSALHTRLDRATALAETDALTGLGNRLRLSRRMQALLASAQPFALLLLDLAKFKRLNDAHGRQAGDHALRIVGQRLQAQVRNADLVARLGGDEFVMLLDGLADAQPLRERALTVAHSIERRLRIGSPAVGPLGVDIGGAISPRHGQTEQALLDAAGHAMHQAMQAGEVYRLAGD